MSCTLAKGRFEVLQIYRLLQCVQNGDKPYIEKLISMGGNGAMHLASVANKPDMLGFLIAQGVRPDMQDRRGRTPLMLDAELGYDGIVSLLAKNNAHMKLVHKEGKGLLFNALDKKRFHAAHFASERGFFDIIKVLSAYAADFGVVTSEGDTLLHFAASGGYTDCCRFLAHRGKSIYFKPNRVIKPGENGCLREGFINRSFFFYFLKGLKYLPKTYVMASYEPKKKKATKTGKTKKTKFNAPMPICTVPPDLIQRRDDGGPPHFMTESYQHATDTHRYDRDHRPGHPIEDDTFSWTSLHHAGQLDIIQLLLEMGASVDPSTLNRATPLMRAIESCRPSCVEYLIKAGVKQNCLDVAHAYADFRVVDLIQAKINTLPRPKENKKPQPVKSPPQTNASFNPWLYKRKGRTTNLFSLGYDICFSSYLKARRRQRFSFEVDFDDFKMPFIYSLY
uniref:Ankyrin repeat and EF-hand domain containing 1a n=1 Tax=Sinocyclocheilus anshuiensis TaxID=1608454 RepID=A0A671PT76_9TELE